MRTHSNELLMKLKKYLSQPFPSPRNTWYIDIFYFSLFVSVFLLVFDPINIALNHKSLILLGYGLVSYITGALLHLICIPLFPDFFNDEQYTIKKHFGWFAIQLIFIGITNHFYSSGLLPFHPKGLEGILIFEFRAFSLGLIPITVQVILTHNYLLAKNLKEATELNLQISKTIHTIPVPSNEVIQLIADNEKDFLELKKDELYYIESIGNYIQVYYNKKGTQKNLILRCSLKKAESVLAGHSGIARCHRAYLVNLQYVTYVKGNSQGYKLIITNQEKEIPVARNFAKDIRKQIEIIHHSDN